jgi:hypothetical protein
MSATTRKRADGSEYAREAEDYYRTPAWAVRVIHPYLPPDSDNLSVLDAGAGDGAIADALPYGLRTLCSEQNAHKREALCEKGYNLVGWEGEADFFSTCTCFDLVVMNPPYAQAMEFVRHAIKITEEENGMVAALLRLPWLASQVRASFHRAHPAQVLVLPRRPSFTKDGKTDATDYAWFCWGNNSGARRPTLAGTWEILEVEGK